MLSHSLLCKHDVVVCLFGQKSECFIFSSSFWILLRVTNFYFKWVIKKMIRIYKKNKKKLKLNSNIRIVFGVFIIHWSVVFLFGLQGSICVLLLLISVVSQRENPGFKSHTSQTWNRSEHTVFRGLNIWKEIQICSSLEVVNDLKEKSLLFDILECDPLTWKP